MLGPSPRRVAWQIGVFSIALLLVQWKAWRLLPGPSERTWIRALLVGVAAAMAVWSVGWPRQSLFDLGLSRRGLRAGWGAVAAFALAGIAALALLGSFRGTRLAWGPAMWIPRYVAGALLQQVLLQAFVGNRIYEATGGSLRAAVLLPTLIMVVLHAPNVALCAAVLLATPFWVWHFRRYRNLAAVALCQAALGCAAMFVLGEGPLLHLRVGLGALELMRG